jgi:glutaredoxin
MRSHVLCLAAMLLCICASGALAQQQLYKSTAPDGRVVYGDKPPTEGRLDKTIKVVEQPGSSLEAHSSTYVALLQRLRESQRRRDAEPVPAPPSDETVLFAAQWCGYCRQAKAFMAHRGIAYREVDIDTPQGLAAFARTGGGKRMPLLVRSNRRIHGFSVASYEAALSKAP